MVGQGNIKDAKLFCDRAFEIAQHISHSREDQRSNTFEFIAQVQAKTGEFDAALKIMQLINIPSYQANVLVTIAQLKSEADAQEKERWNTIITTIADEIPDDRFFLFLDNNIKFWSTVAVAQAAIGYRETALATFAELLDAARNK
ncbi:MAG: hypothetical protein HC773_02795 [Scytonema sp. CRU_2_7]|nr:hypothetical protein [Scytonema sp. CRU_2_7]